MDLILVTGLSGAGRRSVLSALEEVAVAKIDELTRILARTGDPDEIERLAEAIDALITVLRKGMELQESLKRKE
ncbi:MAG: hypothetical protein N3H32_06415 [Nitrososphaeria archaeon]|nr:hypothetical protein [Nitrososphaeria archaeon]